MKSFSTSSYVKMSDKLGQAQALMLLFGLKIKIEVDNNG
ncbi:hypothetical protein ABID96_001336 [Bacillus sp. OAE603]